MKLSHFKLFLLLFAMISCKKESKIAPAKKQQSLISFVNPFIGTGGHGHTYPGATMPFGMMQLSPDTRLDGWDGCSGYHYSDNYIYGFSHTHLSGTGVSDYGDILLMPTNKVIFNNGSDGKEGYRAHFSHENEITEPGYYKVHLDTTNIDVELTVFERSGVHKYQFPSQENQFLMIDLDHRDELLSADLEVVSNTEIKGHRHSKAWAEDQRLFFHIKSSHAFKNEHKDTAHPNKLVLAFDNPNNEAVYIQIGISAVDEDGALKNLEQEIGTSSFEDVKTAAQNAWEQQLEKIVIESNNDDYKTIFYTAMYHSMIAPNIYQDVDGRYRGMDLKVHQNKDHINYSVFSLWDTYRATHPLYTLIEQERTNDFINTFIDKYEEGGIMPIWDLSANYTGCMIGYHAVPVIADAYLKGIRNYDANKAFEAMKHSATRDKLGLKSYKEYSFIPVEEEAESVSKTLEYAYDDWTIAQMAKAMNNTDDYQNYIKRAQYYKNVYDPATKFMRGRIRNTWFTPFDPYEVNFNYTEANSWQYSFYVPQDVSGFIDILGGKSVLENQLDKLFTAKTEITGTQQVDITGLIGQYAHGNEPSHHMAYLYNFVNKPHKTQEYIHQILTELYTNTPDGISGNEDCGQMSSWYIFSALGFYPVTPGDDKYIIGTPLYDKATINLENGKAFTIVANNLSNENKYIKAVTLNGQPLSKSFLKHKDIMAGGSLIFEMTNQPSEWATKDGDIPTTSIKDNLIVTPPFIAKGAVAFKEQTEITLDNITPDVEIYFSINDEAPQLYIKPVIVQQECSLHVYAQKGEQKSPVITTKLFKIDPDISIELNSEYANRYNGGGKNALIDGIKGASDFRAGSWQGYWNTDMEAIVNLGKLRDINSINIGFLEDQRSWIFYPTEVAIATSTDGKTFSKPIIQKVDALTPQSEVHTTRLNFDLSNQKTQYIKVFAKTVGPLPEWHLGHKHDGKAWIFMDEISIK